MFLLKNKICTIFIAISYSFVSLNITSAICGAEQFLTGNEVTIPKQYHTPTLTFRQDPGRSLVLQIPRKERVTNYERILSSTIFIPITLPVKEILEDTPEVSPLSSVSQPPTTVGITLLEFDYDSRAQSTEYLAQYSASPSAHETITTNLTTALEATQREDGIYMNERDIAVLNHLQERFFVADIQPENGFIRFMRKDIAMALYCATSPQTQEEEEREGGGNKLSLCGCYASQLLTTSVVYQDHYLVIDGIYIDPMMIRNRLGNHVVFDFGSKETHHAFLHLQQCEELISHQRATCVRCQKETKYIAGTCPNCTLETTNRFQGITTTFYGDMVAPDGTGSWLEE